MTALDPPDPAARLRTLGRPFVPDEDFGPGVRRVAPAAPPDRGGRWAARPDPLDGPAAPDRGSRWAATPDPFGGPVVAPDPAASRVHAGGEAVAPERVGWPTAAPGTPAARLRLPPEPAGEEPEEDPDDWEEWEEPEPARPSSHGGRLAERWLPASWRDARWDPGRLGAVALAAVAAVAAVVAAIGVWSGRPVPEAVPALPAVADTRPAAAPAPAPGSPLVVSVSGKVRRPGLVRLAGGARVGDAVDAAGGASPGADLTGLNLAARVADGEQVVVGVPAPAAPAAAAGAAPASAGAAGPAPAGKVDLNQATLEQLDGLPGVGPVTAKKILDWRTQNGRFAAIEQLQEVGGIGEARFATLRELVTV